MLSVTPKKYLIYTKTLNSETPLAEVEGHAPHRVSRVQFHPSGRYLGTCCFDNSWRLWDLTKCEEVLHQEGHVKPVYCMSFQCDGSVVATGLVRVSLKTLIYRDR